MIWIIGGTTETGQLLAMLRGRAECLVTVATPAGQALLPQDAAAQILVARLNLEQMSDLLRAHQIATVVDLSHPYAAEVTRNARQACAAAGVRYLRYVREQTAIPADAVRVATVADCAAWLGTVAGCVFFTTGSKNIGDFQAVRGANRFVYRVLPTVASLRECERWQVALPDIVAIFGALSEELNMAMFRAYQARYVVLKDSGRAGGTPEKLRACAQLEVTPVMIGRAVETGLTTLTEVVEALGFEPPAP